MKLSTSAYAAAATCLKRYQYAYVDKIVPRPHRLSKALRRGTWIHRCLEFYHAGRPWLPELTEMELWATDHGLAVEAAMEIRTEVEEIVTGYITYWKAHGEPMETLATEYEVKAEIAGHTFSATLDRLARWRNGVWIVEAKSTENIPSATWRAIDPQTALQYALCAISGIEVEGILFDYLVTKIPPIPKWRKDGEPYANTLKSVTTSAAWERGVQAYAEEYPLLQGKTLGDLDALHQRIVHDGAYYQRYPVYRPEAAIVETLRDVGQTVKAILDAQETGHYRRLNSLMYCPRFCPYQELCATEYVKGGVASVLREELFIPDDGIISREGRAR